MMRFDELHGLPDERYGEFADVVDGYERGLVPLEDLFYPYIDEPDIQHQFRPTTEWDDVLLKKIARDYPVEKYTPDEWYEIADQMHESGVAARELYHFSDKLTLEHVSALKRKAILGFDVHEKAFFDNIKLAAWFARESMGFHRESRLKNNQEPTLIAFSSAPLDAYRFADLPFADRFQVACISLWDSIYKYSPTKGAFASFALGRMSAGLGHAVADNSQSYSVRINYQRQLQIRTLLRMNEEAEAVGKRLNIHDASFVLGMPKTVDRLSGTTLAIEELSSALMRFTKLDIEYVNELLDPADDYETFEDEFEPDYKLGVDDIVQDLGTSDMANRVVDETGLENAIKEALSELTDKEQLIVNLRFGLDGGEQLTLEQVGATVGLSRERIRQIEYKILEKLRNPKSTNVLRNFRQISPGEIHESFRPEVVLTKNEKLDYINNEHLIPFDQSPSKKYTEKPKKKFVYREDWTDDDLAS